MHIISFLFMYDRSISQIKQHVKDIIDSEYVALLGLPSSFDYPKGFLYELSYKIHSNSWSYDKDEYDEGDCHYFMFRDGQNNIRENLTVDYSNNSWNDIEIKYTRYCGDDCQYLIIIKNQWELEKHDTVSRCNLDGEGDKTSDFNSYRWERHTHLPKIEYRRSMKDELYDYEWYLHI